MEVLPLRRDLIARAGSARAHRQAFPRERPRPHDHIRQPEPMNRAIGWRHSVALSRTSIARPRYGCRGVLHTHSGHSARQRVGPAIGDERVSDHAERERLLLRPPDVPPAARTLCEPTPIKGGAALVLSPDAIAAWRTVERSLNRRPVEVQLGVADDLLDPLRWSRASSGR